MRWKYVPPAANANFAWLQHILHHLAPNGCTGLTGSAKDRLAVLAGAIEWVLDFQKAAAVETTEEGKKQAHRRYSDAVLALSQAFALASASDQARCIRDEVAFFQTIRAALVKSAPGTGRSNAERDFAVQQIVSRAVVSTEIIDILGAAGLRTPDISILSDEFLAEIQGMEKKNLALEALRKLLEGDIRSSSRNQCGADQGIPGTPGGRRRTLPQ